MASVDVHQHLWPDPFVQALTRRRHPPRLRGSTLELAGERAGEIDLEAHELGERLRLLDRSEIDVAVVSLQPTLGIDELPEEERSELVTAWRGASSRWAQAMRSTASQAAASVRGSSSTWLR